MRIYKCIIVLFLFTLPSSVHGQYERDTINVLTLKHKKHFRETNKFKRDTTLILRQEVFYNKPRTIDEEYSHNLTIRISDISSLKLLKTLDLKIDSSKISCLYDGLSVWNWERGETIINGKITLISMHKNKIKLKIEISVIDISDNQKLVYSGIRKFHRAWWNFR